MIDYIATVLLTLLSVVLTYIATLDIWKRKIPLHILEKTTTLSFLVGVVASCFGLAYFNELNAAGLASAITDISENSIWLQMLQSWFLPLLALTPVLLFSCLLSVRRNYRYAPWLAVGSLVFEVVFLFSALYL